MPDRVAHSVQSRAAVALLAGAVVLFVGCVRNAPEPRAQNALYRDLERLVTLKQTAGWQVDRVELDEMAAGALMSVCRTTPVDRERTVLWLDDQIAARGGDVREAYLDRGRKLSKVSKLLELTRIRMLLVRTIADAREDCPFWLEQSEQFGGRQLLDDRWLLSGGGGGKLVLLSQGDEQDISGGGAGRLLLGRGIGDRMVLLSGIEFGGAVRFPRDDNGNRGDLLLGVDVVAPVVLRYRRVNSYYEFEAGYLANFTEGRDGFNSGIRIGVAFGAQAARTRWFLPGAAFGVALERTFAQDGDDPLWALKFGFRVAIDMPL